MSNEAENNALAGEEEQRPPVDPHNKLYTVISLLIFAVIYYFRKLHIFAAKDNKLPQTAVYLQ